MFVFRRALFELRADRIEKDIHIPIHSTSDVDSCREIWMEKIKFGQKVEKMQQMRKWTFALSSALAHYSNINLKTFLSNRFSPFLSAFDSFRLLREALSVRLGENRTKELGNIRFSIVSVRERGRGRAERETEEIFFQFSIVSL